MLRHHYNIFLPNAETRVNQHDVMPEHATYN